MLAALEEHPLHSTMFLLIPGSIPAFPITLPALHSTMFLLIQELGKYARRRLLTLHSTMFLLILRMPLLPSLLFLSLHSTMFLLIPVVYSSLQYRYNLTTFCQSCHFIIFILIFIFLDSSHF